MMKGFTVLKSGRRRAVYVKPLHDAFVPNRIESGFRYSLSYSVSDLKILKDDSA
jgi:hypothetical protein